MEHGEGKIKFVAIIAILNVLGIGGYLLHKHHAANTEREDAPKPTVAARAAPPLVWHRIGGAAPRVAAAAVPASEPAPAAAPAPEIPKDLKLATMTLGSPQGKPTKVSAKQIVAGVSKVRVHQQEKKVASLVLSDGQKAEGHKEGVVYGNWLGPVDKMPTGGSGD